MKTNIATDKSQSQRLLACGVPADTADMVWTRFESDGEKYEQLGVMDESAYEVASLNPTPAWSLSRLLSLLPTSIMSPLGNEYMLELSKRRMHNVWEVQWVYSRSRFATYNKQKVFHKIWDKSPIEACVKAIEWLSENGYKLNEQ